MHKIAFAADAHDLPFVIEFHGGDHEFIGLGEFTAVM